MGLKIKKPWETTKKEQKKPSRVVELEKLITKLIEEIDECDKAIKNMPWYPGIITPDTADMVKKLLPNLYERHIKE